MSEEHEECGICGLEIKDKYSHKLICNHKFHYECLMKSFQNTPKLKKECNHCPYCRAKTCYLPLINGLRKVIPGVHCNTFGSSVAAAKESLINNYSVHCQHILIRGKNKGKTCGKNCFIGYKYCKAHKTDINLILNTESVSQITNPLQQTSQDDTSSTGPI